MKTRIFRQITATPTALWDGADSPFTSRAYWQALEDNGLIGEGTDWDSLYVVVMDNNTPTAMLPVFVKAHHQGEYVFDHAWAHAFHRYGINYYPRLVTSVPFTPVVGQRVWLAEGVSLSNDMVRVLDDAVNILAAELNAPTWHGLFIQPEQQQAWQAATLAATPKEHMEASHAAVMQRQGCQFLWHNQGFDGTAFSQFDDFLAKLTAKKRKNIRAERRKVAGAGVRCRWKLGNPSQLDATALSDNADITFSPDPISADDWKTFYHCYAMTYAVRGQQPYLSLEFFTQLAQTLPKHLALAQAVDEQGDVVACSLFFYDDRPQVSTLYGRYWGALTDVNFLHFELCYYQGISFAIALGLQHFDPGTQGEHKLIRGFEPVISYSLHKVFVPKFVPAIREFCAQEQADVAHYAQAATDALPFKRID